MENVIVTPGNTGDEKTVVLEQPIAEGSNAPEQPAKDENSSTKIEKLDNNESLEALEEQLAKQKEALNNQVEDESNLVKDAKDNESNISEADKSDKTEQQNLNKHLVKIDKDYISKAPEEQREILESILGKKEYTLSDPQLLKNYVNSQMKIKEDLAEIERLKNEKRVPDFSKEEVDEVSSLTNSLVENELKSVYPDMPSLSNKDELNYWIIEKNSEDPLFAMDFRDRRREYESSFKKEAENEVLLTKNWQSMAQNQTEKEIGEFENYVKGKGLSLADLDINPTDPEFIKSILFKDNKNNPDVIQMYKGRIPVVVNGRVKQLLQNRYIDLIIEKKEIAARQSAFTKKQSLEGNPSLSGAKVGGKISDTDSKNGPVRKFSDSDSLEAMEAELKRQQDLLRKEGVPGLSIS